MTDVAACWRGAGFPQLCNVVTGHCVNSKLVEKLSSFSYCVRNAVNV